MKIQKLITYCLFGAALLCGAASVKALSSKPAPAFVCGGGCTIKPRTRCPGGCFCDVSLGDGVNTGICAVI
jgi:hypothetical protein